MLIKASLEKLLTEAKTSQLREEIKHALAESESGVEAPGIESADQAPENCDNYWPVFCSALSINQPPRTREVALDVLQKLIAHKALKGASPLSTQVPDDPSKPSFVENEDIARTLYDLDATSPVYTGSKSALSPQYPPQPFLIDEIIHCICTSYTLASVQNVSEDLVQLQLLKVLLTVVTSTHVEIHDISLLKCIQTCINIYQGTKSHVNAVTVKASLTQMCNAVFVRLERWGTALKKGGATPLSSVSDKGVEEPSIKVEIRSLESSSGSFISKVDKVDEPPSPASEAHIAATMPSDLVSSPTTEGYDEAVDCNDGESAVNKSEDSPTDSIEPNSDEQDVQKDETCNGGSFELHEGCRVSMELQELIIQTDVDGNTSPLLYQLGMSMEELIENTSNAAVPISDLKYYVGLLLNDVYMLFRLLCRLALDGESTEGDLTIGASRNLSESQMKLRTLSLELILSVMGNAGAVFRGEDIYISLMKEKICFIVARNAIQSNPHHFELAIGIWVLVMQYYRSHFKADLEVLILHFMSLLETAPSPIKNTLLRALTKCASNPHLLADLYLNYDCDLGMQSLFERLVGNASRLTQTKSKKFEGGLFSSHKDGDIILRDERKLKSEGLKFLVEALGGLASWTRDIVDLPFVDVLSKPIIPTDSDAEEREPVINRHVERLKSSALPRSSSTNRISVDTLRTEELLPTAYSNAHIPVIVSGKNPLQAISIGPTSPLVQNSPDDDQVPAEELASRKQLYRQVIKVFNNNPVKGLKQLIFNGFVGDDTFEIVRFLRTPSDITKIAIGEYLGSGEQEHIKMMHSFVDSLDFTDIGFVDSLRGFLQLFRLPGEAQKIDRIMEKFADRYCECSPRVFAKADTAYTLAFSIIMLNTDLHSNQIKNKMDKAAFLKNNRGINDNGDLPDEFLGAIYDDILANEIIMEEERISTTRAVGEFSKTDMLPKKKHFMLKRGERKLMTPFVSASSSELVRPMFGVACWPVMASLALLFEEAEEDDEEMVDYCLQGFALSIRLSSVFLMETERDAFVTSLAKLTGLMTTSFYGEEKWIVSLKLRMRNIKAVKTLIALANALGEWLQGSWAQVLKVISQLERVHMVMNQIENGGSNEKLPEGDTSASSLPSTDSRSLHINGAALLSRNPALEKYGHELGNQMTVVAIDRIFASTSKFSGPAIVHLVKSLCMVSAEEMGIDPSYVQTAQPALSPTIYSMYSATPRMYLLQKIVEIAHYNMYRIRFEWAQIWKTLQPYFNTVGCHPNNVVASFAIDSLRQLSMKFLERDELAHYHTQNEFLKSFEWIIKQTSSVAIREQVLQSLLQMIYARARNIKSGWKSIFIALAKVASIPQDGPGVALGRKAFNVLQQIHKEYFSFVVSAGAFVDFVNCAAEFALSELGKDDEIVMKSFMLLKNCAEVLSTDNVPTRKPSTHFDQKDLRMSIIHTDTTRAEAMEKVKHATDNGHLNPEPNSPADNEEDFFLKWFPIFSAFSRVVVESRSMIVRTAAIDTLFEVLRVAGRMFPPKFWDNIFRTVIFPIFEDLIDPDDQKKKLKDTESEDIQIWIHGIRSLVDIYSTFFDVLADSKEFATILMAMFESKDKKLANTALISLMQYLKGNWSKFTTYNVWEKVTQIVEGIFDVTTAWELMPEQRKLMRKSLDDGAQRFDKNADIEDKIEIAEAVEDAHSPQNSRVFEYRLPDTLQNVEFGNIILKCSIHLELIQNIRDLLLLQLVVTDGEDRLESPMTVTPYPPTSPLHRSRPSLSGRSDSTFTPPKMLSPTQSFSERNFLNKVPVLTTIPAQYLVRWVKCVRDSYEFAHTFNMNEQLRTAILVRKLTNQKPNLIKQETISLSGYFRVMFNLYGAYGDQFDGDAEMEKLLRDANNGPLSKRLVDETTLLLDRFVTYLSDQTKHAREISLWSPVVITIYLELLNMEGIWKKTPESDLKFVGIRKELNLYFKLGIRIVPVERLEVRNILQLFMEKVGDVYIQF